MLFVSMCNTSDSLISGMIAIDATYRLDLARINLDDPDSRSDQLLSQTLGEATNGGLGGAVDAAAGVRLAAYIEQSVGGRYMQR